MRVAVRRLIPFLQMRKMFSSSIESTKIIGYCTDVEGDLNYWNRYVGISRVLFRDESDQKLKVRPNSIFVFGGSVLFKIVSILKIFEKNYIGAGDAFDRGEGDLRFAEELCDLVCRQ